MNGKTALVTGAGRGIGRGIAEALGGLGWTVAINYRNDGKAAENCLKAVKSLGGDGFLVPADVSDLASHEPLIREVIAKAGRIDMLVNNAGMAPKVREDMLLAAPESYDEVMAVNLKGPFFLSQRTAIAMIDYMKCRPRSEPAYNPVIVNISSISAETASVNRAEYCISKAGISMTTKLWAVRLAEYGIRVYEVRPGIIKTDMTMAVREKYDSLLGGGIALIPRWGTPGDVGRVVAAIAQGVFSYATGAVFTVDGGMGVPRL